jgi:membrane-bound lytic murein transglycosylase B
MRLIALFLALFVPMSLAMPLRAETPGDFAPWLADFRDRALAAGISEPTLDAALPEVNWLPDVITRDRNQFEFTRTIWDYLDRAVSDDRIAFGRRALTEHGDVLQEIEARYGVDRHVVAAIWGLESSYGAVRGDVPVLSALATLAHDGRRGAFFEEQLIAALGFLDRGEVALSDLRGSWAGAMGHTQFMPTSLEAHGQDLRGDGRRDVWSDDPADALASAAAYLAANGWVTGQPWGVEVILPEGFDYTLARDTNRQSPAYWASLGVTGVDGAPVPDHGTAVILLPGGHRGAALMIFRNFNVIETYNTADAYVVAVGHLADRLQGAPPFMGDWPRDERALTFDERIELQERLTAAGFDTRGIDARVGPLTVAAIRGYQRARGMVPDGFPSVELLERLREE